MKTSKIYFDWFQPWFCSDASLMDKGNYFYAHENSVHGWSKTFRFLVRGRNRGSGWCEMCVWDVFVHVRNLNTTQRCVGQTKTRFKESELYLYSRELFFIGVFGNNSDHFFFLIEAVELKEFSPQEFFHYIHFSKGFLKARWQPVNYFLLMLSKYLCDVSAPSKLWGAYDWRGNWLSDLIFSCHDSQVAKFILFEAV